MNDIIFAGCFTAADSASRHSHEGWELMYCTSGSGEFRFGQVSLPYQQGDVVVIPPGVPHSHEGGRGSGSLCIHMSSPILTLKEPAVVTDGSAPFLRQAFEAAVFHFQTDSKERSALLSAYGSLICYYLIAAQADKPRPSVVDEIEQHILRHYADCDFKLEEYMASLPLSDNTLRKRFRETYGVTPHQYLTARRLQAAAGLLRSCTDTVSDIAAMCGFRDPLYFSHMFKKKYGMSPSLYAASRTAPSEAGDE